MLDSGATVNVIPATFVKDKMELLRKNRVVGLIRVFGNGPGDRGLG